MKLFIEAHFSGFKSSLYLKETITITNFSLKIVCIIAHKFLHNATFSYEHTQAAFVLQIYACEVSICTSKINKGLHKFEGFWHNFVWFSIFKHPASHILNIKEFMSALKSGPRTFSAMQEKGDKEPPKVHFLHWQGLEKLRTSYWWNTKLAYTLPLGYSCECLGTLNLPDHCGTSLM